MSTTNAISSTSSMQDLAARITKRFDSDGDGRLSSDEFAGFLTGLMGGLGPAGGAVKTASAPQRAPVDPMPGFDSGKLADTTHKTVKYEVARVLQFYPHTPAGLQAALPELQALFPTVSITGSKGDKLDFGDYTSNGERIGAVDVIFAAGEGGRAWAWMPVE